MYNYKIDDVWVFAVVFQSFKNYFVPSTFPNKGISVDVLEKYGTFYTLFKQTRFLSMLAKFTA